MLRLFQILDQVMVLYQDLLDLQYERRVWWHETSSSRHEKRPKISENQLIENVKVLSPVLWAARWLKGLAPVAWQAARAPTRKALCPAGNTALVNERTSIR